MVGLLLLLVPLPRGFVVASDPRIEYVGRVDRRTPGVAKVSWPACAAVVRVRGTGLTAMMSDTGIDWVQEVVDGKPTASFSVSGVKTVTVSFPKGVHQVRFVKRTEPFSGALSFLGFKAKGRLVQAALKPRLLEVIGDSITCGYGNLAHGPKVHFKPETEDAYLSYASVAARRAGAEVEIDAWSGRKMWPDDTIPAIYDLTIPTDPTSVYDFRGEVPLAIAINLATNDFGGGNPDEAKWTAAYEAFVNHLRGFYPHAELYLLLGSMMSDAWPPNHGLSTARAYLRKIETDIRAGGDTHVHFLEFPTQSASDGYGADWHPSVATDRKMGSQLAAALKRDLGWSAR